MQARLSLSELRRRTDRQLLVLVRGEIEKSLKLIRHDSSPEAEAGYAKARTLLSIARAPEQERARLEARLEELRAALEGRRNAPMVCRQYTAA